MADTPSQKCSNKKLSQTKISSYFTGCSKTPNFDKQPLIRKRRVRKSSKKLSFSSTSRSGIEMAESDADSSLSMDSLLASIPKRKLPAPIFSEDEDSENDRPTPGRRSFEVTPRKQPRVLLSLNRPGPVSPEKIPPLSTPSTSSSALSPKKTDNKNVTPSRAGQRSKLEFDAKNNQTINVLQNIVISPQKSPQKGSVKDETKKVNFEQLKVMREFFINILKHNHLINLFSSNDKQLLTNFFNSEKHYQYVCIKLFMWKPMWYNVYKFAEKIGLTLEDQQINEMYKDLKDNGFVETDYMGEDTFTLLDLLMLKEVRDIGRGFRLPNLTGTKDAVIAKLIKNCKTQVTLTSQMNSEEVLRTRIKEKMGFCVKLSPRLTKCLYCVYLLNTFANSTLTDPHDYFKNVSYFHMAFPNYNIDNFLIFYTPLELARYADAVKLRSDLDKALEKKNVCHIYEICRCAYEALKEFNEELGTSFDDARESHLERFTPNAQYCQILSTGSPHITKSYYDQVMVWFEYLLTQGYCKHKRGQWYSHLLLIYTLYTKNYETAARLLIKALQEEKEDFSDIQLQELAHRGKMLNRKTYNLPQLLHDEIAALSEPLCDRDWPRDVINDCQSMKSEEPGRRRTYVLRGQDGDTHYLHVEQLALKHYQTVGYPKGDHCEGSLIVASFCLLFWDIIYETYVKGTFVSNVQNAPLDMYTKYFYINREEKIKKRLNNIKQTWKDEVFKKKLAQNWQLHSHESSLCQVDAAVDQVETLYQVIQCIGRPILATICERLVKNFRLYHSGFPDLIVWNLQEKKAKFVEVKSENDKLSIKQKLWLNFLIDAGASVAVCHVEPKASKKKLVKGKELKVKKKC